MPDLKIKKDVTAGMRYEDFNFKEHGFVGHLAEPDNGSDRGGDEYTCLKYGRCYFYLDM